MAIRSKSPEYLINRLPTNSNIAYKTPYEMIHGEQPNLWKVVRVQILSMDDGRL